MDESERWMAIKCAFEIHWFVYSKALTPLVSLKTKREQWFPPNSSCLRTKSKIGGRKGEDLSGNPIRQDWSYHVCILSVIFVNSTPKIMWG